MSILDMDNFVCLNIFYVCSSFNCLLSPPSLLYSLLLTLIHFISLTFNCPRWTSFYEVCDLFPNGMIFLSKSCDHRSSGYFFSDLLIINNLEDHFFWLLLLVLNLELPFVTLVLRFYTPKHPLSEMAYIIFYFSIKSKC